MQARNCLKEGTFELVLCDLHLEDGHGFDFLKELRKEMPHVHVMIMTGFATLDSAVEALRLGVMDYLVKPIDPTQLELALERLENILRLQAENTYLREDQDARFEGIVWGNSPQMQRVKHMVEKIGPADTTVLISGESGTGKEVAAQAIFAHSPRNEAAFIKVNCAAVPANLLESEFFGHEKGAFTGAVSKREGRFELANKGTLLLDEISEIPPDLQVKLLRVLQEREFERVGGNKTIKVDVRVIATTNRNLANEVREGNFREDLFYRLNVVPIELPALRDRGEDLVLLGEHFLERFCRKHRKPLKGFSPEARLEVMDYHWPGNIRELQNVMERAVILASEKGFLEDLQLNVTDAAAAPLKGEKNTYFEEGGDQENLSIEIMEQRMIRRALARYDGNRTHASKALGISLRTLRNKLARYRQEGIVVE